MPRLLGDGKFDVDCPLNWLASHLGGSFAFAPCTVFEEAAFTSSSTISSSAPCPSPFSPKLKLTIEFLTKYLKKLKKIESLISNGELLEIFGNIKK